MNENTIVKLIKNIDVTDLSGEKVMIDFSTGKYFLLKGAANEIWDMFSNSDSKEFSVLEIKNELMEIYEVDEETCLNSIMKFLNQMSENGFIEVKN